MAGVLIVTGKRRMYLKPDNIYSGGSRSFNMTPVIDMVFLLIIFFSLVSQFIEAENFEVSIPDLCRYAENRQDTRVQLTTVTVIKNNDDKVDFAVGSEKIVCQNGIQAADKIAQLLNGQLKNLAPAERVVVLRIDKEVAYSDAQYALAGIAKSIAGDIQLAVLKDKNIK
jgi:biopolymer transport protein ExbD